MKYLKPLHEKFDFGYEREIIEDFIEEMNEFGIKSFSIIHNANGEKFQSFDDFLEYRNGDNNILYKKGNYFINIQGEVKKDMDFGNISAFKKKNVLAKDQYDHVKGLIDDFRYKIEDLTNLKIIEVGINADIRYYLQNKDIMEEYYSNLRYVITTRSNPPKSK